MKRYSQATLAVIASSLHSEGGDWRSIYFLVRHLQSKGEQTFFINPSGKRGLRQFLATAFWAPRILVNGLGTVMRWDVLLLCLFRKTACVYLHETDYMLDIAEKTSPLKFRVLVRILKRNPVFCVSKQAEALYQARFGSQKTFVVYECPGANCSQAKLDKTKKHIVMVGSINERKGVELFSKVADLAADSHPGWQFHWVGSLATMNPIYQSTNVTWHGWQWQPGNIVERCDLFFLSSVDDPCPLAALEAMQQGLGIIAYRETGTAEIIEEIVGCGVFEDYSDEAVMVCLQKALSAGSDPEQVKEKARAITGVEAFSKRIEEAFAK